MTCKAPPHVSEAWGGAQVPEGPPGSPGDAALLLQEPWLRTLEGHSTVSALSAAMVTLGSDTTARCFTVRERSQACSQVAGNATLPARDAVYN